MKARDLFRAAVTAKLGWYGAEVLAVREVARTPEAVAAAYKEAMDVGAELVLFAGASAIDPLDPAYAELAHAGGDLLQLGAPMHPGSMLWLGRLHAAAVVGVASCAGFGRNSSLDLLLPFVFAYGRADAGDLLRPLFVSRRTPRPSRRTLKMSSSGVSELSRAKTRRRPSGDQSGHPSKPVLRSTRRTWLPSRRMTKRSWPHGCFRPRFLEKAIQRPLGEHVSHAISL